MPILVSPIANTMLRLGIVAAISAAGAISAAAQNSVVLSLDGKTRDGTTYEWTLDDLEQMPQAIIHTATPWHDHVVEFEGVKLSDLMHRVGALGDTAFVVALNEYTAEIPISDFEEWGPILALRQDGELMPISDKGPLFIVYPFGDDAELRAEKYYLRSVWSVSSITIE